MHSASNYFSVSSNLEEMNDSDSEGSGLLILPRHKSTSFLSTSSESNNDQDNSKKLFCSPLATSSPLNENNQNKNDCNEKSKYSIKTSDITENREKKQGRSILNINKPLSLRSFNDFTNISNTKQFPITSGFTKNMLNIENTNNIIRLNSLSDGLLNSNLNETTNAKGQLQSSSIGNNSSNHIKFDENYMNQTDLSVCVQMDLSLKMFSENIVPYLNSLKHDLLQLMNNCMYKPDGQKKKRSKNVNDIIKKIHNTMKLNMNTCDTKLNKKNYMTTPFVAIDLNSLNSLNDKLKHFHTILEPMKSLLNDKTTKTSKDQKDDQESTKQLDVQTHDFGSCGDPSDYTDDLKSPEPIIDYSDNVISPTKTITQDSFDHMRELNISNTQLSYRLPSFQNSIVYHESSPKLSLTISSLNCTNEVPNENVSEMAKSDINLSYQEPPSIDIFTLVNNIPSSSLEVENHDDNQVEKNANRYWLRKHPNSTKHYFAPLNSISCKRKSCRIKTKYNDVFITEGAGKKKKILQYKLHSLLPINSNELIKKICPESINKDQNTTLFDVANLEPKTNYKPCRCGIFPSQVPSYWNNSLHKSIHQNLHKLRFDIETTVDVVSKINDNGFLYDIIKITKNCNNDKNLKLTLKNVQDFINLELDYPKKKFNRLNHSIFLAVIPNLNVIGYVEIDLLENACIYQNNQLSNNLIAVKFGVSKLWVMVKYRNLGVATKLLEQFRNEENLKTNDIAFAYHGSRGISFIKKYFSNDSVLFY